jgi:transcriptional regulator with XRE-family HTH domain
MKELLNAAAIGLAVRVRREHLKMTASDLSSQTGITNSSISRTENGARCLSLVEAIKIAKALDLTIQELIDRATKLEESGAVSERNAAALDFQRALEKATATAEAAREH